MSWTDYLKELLGFNVRRIVKEIQEDITHSIIARINVFQRQIMKRVVGTMIILCACLFLAISAVFLFIEYFQLTRTLAFLIVGIIILFIGLIIRLIK